MAIKTFKEIIDNKGYRISTKDREIFEEGTLQSFFGFSDSDMIEFIVYDANENQLPQGDEGKLVRYIPLSSENIKDYFLIADGTKFQAFQFPNEYFIDAERLIKVLFYILNPIFEEIFNVELFPNSRLAFLFTCFFVIILMIPPTASEP